MSLMFTLSLFAVGLITWRPDHFRSQTEIAFILGAVWMGVTIFKERMYLAAALFAYAGITGALIFAAPTSPYAQLGPRLITSFDSISAQAFAFMFLIVVPLIVLPKKHFPDLKQAFRLLGVLQAGMMVVNNGVGVLDNGAMDGAFLACLMPLLSRFFVFNRARFSLPRTAKGIGAALLTEVLPLVAIFMSKSSTALAALALSLVAFYRPSFEWLCPERVGRLFKWSEATRRAVAWAMGLVLSASLVAGVGYALMGSELLNGNGRYDWWTWTVKFISESSDERIAFGYGLGSYFLFGSHIQSWAGVKDGPWIIWAHNDWLQVFFELGAVGFTLLAALFYESLKRFYKAQKYRLFSVLVTYGFTAITQMPTRHALPALFGAFLVRLAFERN